MAADPGSSPSVDGDTAARGHRVRPCSTGLAEVARVGIQMRTTVSLCRHVPLALQMCPLRPATESGRVTVHLDTPPQIWCRMAPDLAGGKHHRNKRTAGIGLAEGEPSGIFDTLATR